DARHVPRGTLDLRWTGPCGPRRHPLLAVVRSTVERRPQTTDIGPPAPTAPPPRDVGTGPGARMFHVERRGHRRRHSHVVPRETAPAGGALQNRGCLAGTPSRRGN